MYKWFKPTFYLKGFESLTPAFLSRHGIRVLLLDVDNTLSDGHGLPAAPTAEAHLNLLKESGFLLCILSNNNEERVGAFAAPLGIPYIAHAQKPKGTGVLCALELLGETPDGALLVGDQLFTDIWCGTRGKIRTALVVPRGGAETAFIRLKRALEKPFLNRIKKDDTILREDA